MILTAVLLFMVFLALSALFSSSETAFIAVNPYTLASMEEKGQKRATHIRKALARVQDLLATILIGNTLANAAAASTATYIFVSLFPENKNQAVVLATVATAALLLFFSELNPKTYAAHHPIRVTSLVIHPIRFFKLIFFPLAKGFSFLSGIIFPKLTSEENPLARKLNEEEIRIFLTSGIRGMSSLRKKMIAGILDISTRPVREIMIPRPQVRGIEINTPLKDIASAIRDSGHSRFPVYTGRLDNIEGVIHAKDIISKLCDHGDFDIRSVLRKPFFIPELAPLEKALLQMQEKAVHMALVVDEFGTIEGIVTLEDIIEEITGDIHDEYDIRPEDWLTTLGDSACIIKGSASIKNVNERLSLKIPEKADYTTLAGFFLYEFGRLPKEGDTLIFRNDRYTVEKMNKRHISLIRVETGVSGESP